MEVERVEVGPITLKALRFVFDWFFILLLFTLTVNTLIADWSLNPVYNLLFLRIHGAIFYNSHVSSILSMCVAAIYLIVKAKFKDPGIWTVGVFATGSLHEFLLALTNIGLMGSAYFQTIVLSPTYVIWLGAFLILAVVFTTKFQKRILFWQILFFMSFYLLDILVKPGSSQVGFIPTAQFLNPLTNSFEVGSWIIPVSFWFIPEKVVVKK